MDKRRLELLIEFAKLNNIQSAEQAIDAWKYIASQLGF